MATVEVFGNWFTRGFKKAAAFTPAGAIYNAAKGRRQGTAMHGTVDMFGVWYEPWTWFTPSAPATALKPVAPIKAKPQTSAAAVKTQIVAKGVKSGLTPEQAKSTADAIVPTPALNFKNPVVIGGLAAGGVVIFLATKKNRRGRR
jgi:hypothetical protein